MKFQAITISFALLTMVGCKNIFEDNDVTLDGSNPYNTIESPAANNTYSSGDALKLQSSFTDKDQVAEVDVKIVSVGADLRGNSSVISFKRYPNKNQYKLDTTLAANSFAPGTYQLLIRSVDTRKNEGTTEIRFSVN